MQPEQKNQPDHPGSDASKNKQQQRRPMSKTAFWIVMMLWPLVALSVLSLLSLMINYVAVRAARPSQVINIDGSKSAVAGATPAWAEAANTIILICVGVALLGVMINFAIGLFALYKKRFRLDLLS